MPKLTQNILRLRFQNRSVEEVDEERLSAFSASSRLARYVVTLEGKPRRQIHLRSNVWPASAVAVARALHREGLRVPNPLLYSRTNRTVVYEELPGRPIRTLPLTLAKLRPLLPRLGRLLARVHSTPIPRGLDLDSRAKERAHLRRCFQRIRTHAPEYLPEAKALVALAHPGNGSVRSVLTHGDFQSSNILIDDRGQLSLIDFTLSRRSSPAADLATLLIHTDAMTRGRIPEAPRRALLQSAVRAYLKASPAWRRRTTLDDLPGRLAESILDVCAITLESYGARDRNARSLVSHLLALDVTNAYV